MEGGLLYDRKKNNRSLGSNKIEQMSINSEVDIDRIVSIYKKNLDFLNKQTFQKINMH